MTGRSRQPLLAGIAAVAFAWQGLCPPAGAAESESDLGRRFAFEAGAEIPLVRDPVVVGYVERIGGRIVAGLGAQPFDYHFFVIRDARVNAFAVPGGYVYVHSGLLALVANDDELAGVLGHEIAHVHAHHLLRQQEATKWLNYAQLIGLLASFVQPAVGAAAMGASATVQLKYKREYEQEADYLGARYVQAAGFAPRGMLDFFQKLASQERYGPGAAPPYLLTHPLTEERLTRLEAVLHTSQWEASPRRQVSSELRRVRLAAQLQGGTLDALDHYQKQVALFPNDAESRYALGAVLLESGSYAAALETLEQARSLGAPGVDREIGRAYLRLRQPDKARELLARAVEIAPADAVAQFEYGRVLEELGDSEGARSAYERAVAAYADLADAQWQLGLLDGRAGRAGEGYCHLGKAYLLRGEYPQALRQFEKAEAQLPAGEQKTEVKDLLARLREARASRSR